MIENDAKSLQLLIIFLQHIQQLKNVSKQI